MNIEAALTYDKVRYDRETVAHLVASLTGPGGKADCGVTPFASDVLLEIDALAGHQIEGIVSDVEAGELDFADDLVVINIPSLLADERRDVVLAVRLKAQKRPFPRSVNVFACKLAYDIVSAAGKTERETLEAKAKAQFVAPEQEVRTPEDSLDKIVVLAEIVRAQIAGRATPSPGDLRRKTLVDLRAALERGDELAALRISQVLVGLAPGDPRAAQHSTAQYLSSSHPFLRR